MKRQSLISPGSLTRMLQTAEESWMRKDFQQCIETLERASRLAPGNLSILLQLGRIHGLRYDYASAERCFEKVIGLAPKRTDALTSAGEHCLQFASHQLAESYFRRASEQKDVSPESLIKLAEIYERLHRLDDANTLVERALRANPTCSNALLARARLDRNSGKLETAEKLLRAFPSNSERTVRIRGWYELGAVLDRQGRYDEAMSAFLEAKGLLRAEALPFIEQLQKKRLRLREMQANISAEMLERWLLSSQALQPPRRLALLCGHPRSGTTLIEQVLDSHPDIISAEETEVFHDEAYVPLRSGFPEGTALMLPVLEAAQVFQLQQSRDRYFQAMELCLGGPIGDRLLIDKNPSLTYLIPAILRVFPETRLLVAMRDPRDVCLSCFMQPFVPIGPTSSAYLSLESTISEYASLMGIWQTIAPLIKNPYLEVRYEDIVSDLESVSHRMLEFLGAPWDPQVLHFDEHAKQKLVRSPTYADVAKPIFKRALGRWQKYEKHFAPHVEKMQPLLKAFGYEP
jgi:tetratricopeptide (TPR) repeat protein